MKRNLLTSIAVATLVALAALPAARAATETWSTTPGSALWNATNWTGTNNPPLTGDSLIFGNSTLTTLTNDLTTSGFVINTLTFSAGAPAYTISGNAFTLGSQIVNSSSVTQTINDDIILSNASQSVMGNLTLGGTITSAGASTYINFGAGAVGTTTIKGSATIGANGFDVGNGATLKIDGASGNFSTSGSWRNGGNGAVIVTNGGSFNVAGDLWGALHSVTQDSGTVTLGTSSSNLLQYVTFATSGGTATINGQLYQGIKIDASGTAVVNLGASQSLVINDPAVTGVLSVAGSAAVTFANTLNLANTTSAGTINLNGGTLTVPGFYKTNTASATTFNFNGGTLKFSALNTVASTANTTFNVLAGGAVIDTQSYAVALQQRLLGASAGGLTKLGNGTLTLGGANTYTGTTTVNSGLIGLDVAENAGANGPLGNPATQANSIVLQGGGLQFTGNNTYDYTSYGRLQLADGFTGTIDTNGQSVTFANAIGVGALKTAALTKAGSGNLTLAAANTYTGATTVSAGTLKVGNATALSTSAVSVTSGAALDLNGTVMTGTNALTLNGTGITSGGALINSSATAGTYAGLITLGSASSIIAGTGNIAVSNPGTITGAYGLTLGGAQNGSLASIIGTGAGTLTKQDAGTWILSGANTYTGTTTVTGGLLNLNVAEIAGTSGPLGNSTAANSIVLQGGGLQFTSNNTYDYSGRLQLADASTGTINTNGQNVTFANAIGVGSLKTGALTKSGSGTLTLNAANTYTGTTTVSGGTLKVGNATALGTGTASVTSGAALDLNGTVMTGTNGLTLNGTGVNGSGALMNSSASAGTYAGLIALGSASSIIAGSGNITLSHAGTISGAYGLTLGGSKNGSIASIIGTGAGTLTKQDGGIWTLTGANTYTGATTISVGVLNIQNATALGTTAAGTTVAVGAALQLQNSITVGAEALTLNGAGINNDGALRNISGTNIWQGTVTLGSAARINSDSGSLTFNTAANSITGAFNLTLGGAGNGTVGGTITIGAGTLTKDGAGIWTLSGANTYTGATTVNGGLLQLNVAEIANTSGPLGKQLAAAANTIVLQGGGLQFTSNNTNDYSGRLQLADGFTGTIDTNGQNVAFATAIGVGTLKSGALTKAGTGTLTLTGNNTYNGKTLVSAGTLALGANLALQNSAIDTSGAGNITLSVTTPTFGGLIGSTDLTTVITSGYSSVTALTLNPSAGISNSYSGVIAEGAAGMTLTKSGAGTQILSGANTYNGTTTVSVGVLNIQNATALGTTANGTSVTSGAALQIQNNITVGAETLALNGTGIASNGALRNISGDNIWQGTVTLGSAARINSDSGSLTFNTAANSITGTQNLTLGGAGNGTIAGTITTSTGTLTKDGAGTWTLSGANTYTGTTTISGGTLDLGGGTANGSLASTVLSLGGGTLAYTRTGGTTQNFTGNTTINAGASSVTAAAGDTLNLGTITRNIGGTVDFGTTGSIITSTGNTTGILGGWATFGGTTWAVSNGASAITGLASYTNDIWAAANNTDVTGNSTQTGNTTNSLRFNATGANTLTLNGTNIITSGGILVTSAVGNNTTTITGGTLAGAASKDLVVIQNNTLNGLTIASTIANNTGATALTKSGAGALTLNATNTYTGGTY
ncbi:MAG: autotransporter-associated beta strand repeat-containing protein, partial [Verrucomicrobiae bacterium]